MSSDIRNTFCLTVDRRPVTVLADSVLFAQVTDKLCTIYLINSEPIRLFISLGALMELLPADDFIQISRSCVVSLLRIRTIRDDCLILSDGTSLPYSRHRKSAILEAFRKNMSQRSHDSSAWELTVSSDFRCFDHCPFPFFIIEITAPAAFDSTHSPVILYANDALASFAGLSGKMLIHLPIGNRDYRRYHHALNQFSKVALSGGTAQWYGTAPDSGRSYHIFCYQPHVNFCAVMIVPAEERHT